MALIIMGIVALAWCAWLLYDGIQECRKIDRQSVNPTIRLSLRLPGGSVMHERVCPECGAAFVPRYGGQVCCSDKCKAARKKMLDDKRYQFRDQKSEIAFREERREKARRRAEFFAARDAAFERAGLPIPKIEVRNGVRIESRGVVAGRPSGKSSLQISSKSYYYRRSGGTPLPPVKPKGKPNEENK